MIERTDCCEPFGTIYQRELISQLCAKKPSRNRKNLVKTHAQGVGCWLGSMCHESPYSLPPLVEHVQTITLHVLLSSVKNFAGTVGSELCEFCYITLPVTLAWPWCDSDCQYFLIFQTSGYCVTHSPLHWDSTHPVTVTMTVHCFGSGHKPTTPQPDCHSSSTSVTISQKQYFCDNKPELSPNPSKLVRGHCILLRLHSWSMPTRRQAWWVSYTVKQIDPWWHCLLESHMKKQQAVKQPRRNQEQLYCKWC
jgi:hypothetical protein